MNWELRSTIYELRGFQQAKGRKPDNHFDNFDNLKNIQSQSLTESFSSQFP